MNCKCSQSNNCLHFLEGKGLAEIRREEDCSTRQTDQPASKPASQQANQVAAAASRSDEITFQTEQNPGQAGAGGHKHNI